MLFNSIEFAVFLPIVLGIYWLIKSFSLKIQNSFLLIASYVFYGWWDWRFLSLIFFSSLVDFSIGLAIAKEQSNSKRKKLLLATSLLTNLGLLGIFKYYNFFLENFVNAFTFFGSSFNVDRIDILLPVGISFYTFQTLSYTIDVYREKLKPTNDLIAFLSFVSFFPQLVAGPIERASNLLPQFFQKRNINVPIAIDGCRQILWGFFKKIVVADNCAVLVNDIFLNYSTYNASTLLIGAILFSFQIYADFSGYSDIAIGTAKLFGFSLKQNFAFPYFSRGIAEFWRKWHISLTTWFRDYLYIPIGGSRGNKWITTRNILVIFLVSGFWHGANWTFITWGAINALYFLPIILFEKNRLHLSVVAENGNFPTLKEFFQIVTTFLITSIAWIFFRSENISHAFNYISSLSSITILDIPEVNVNPAIPGILVLIFLEWIHRKEDHGLKLSSSVFTFTKRWFVYFLLILFIVVFGVFEKTEFIYFTF